MIRSPKVAVTPMHPERAAALAEVLASPAGDWESIYRQTVLRDFAFEMRTGFFLSYYRSFAIPRIAEQLARTGTIASDPRKRSYDTGLILHELIAAGFGTERGEAMVDLLVRVHSRVDSESDDFAYILLGLLIVPLRWLRAHGWRALTPVEEAAAFRFYRELGKRLGIKQFPKTLEAAEAWFEKYEADEVCPSPAGRNLVHLTIGVLAGRLPVPVRPLTPVILSTLLEDPRLSIAFGLPRSHPLIHALVGTALRVSGVLRRRMPFSKHPAFRPGLSGSSVYPNGYKLSDLGPHK